jgi:hypothetical protein
MKRAIYGIRPTISAACSVVVVVVVVVLTDPGVMVVVWQLHRTHVYYYNQWV